MSGTMLKAILATVAAVVIEASVPAHASVLYTFTTTGPSIALSNDDDATYTGSFSYLANNFISVPTTGFSSCNAVSSNGGGSCVPDLTQFLHDFYSAPLYFDIVQFGVADPNRPSGDGLDYYFELGAFITYGTSYTVGPPYGLNPGELVVSNVPTATPLPAALPLFATGLGAMGLLGWLRKRKAQAIAA